MSLPAPYPNGKNKMAQNKIRFSWLTGMLILPIVLVVAWAIGIFTLVLTTAGLVASAVVGDLEVKISK